MHWSTILLPKPEESQQADLVPVKVFLTVLLKE
jgi:hypothetical protein